MYESTFSQWLLSLDVSWLFLFLAIKLLGYRWTWFNLIACLGAWVVIKEVFKQIRIIMIAKEIAK